MQQPANALFMQQYAQLARQQMPGAGASQGNLQAHYPEQGQGRHISVETGEIFTLSIANYSVYGCVAHLNSVLRRVVSERDALNYEYWAEYVTSHRCSLKRTINIKS